MRESANLSTKEMNVQGLLFILNRFSFGIIFNIHIFCRNFSLFLRSILHDSDPLECLIS